MTSDNHPAAMCEKIPRPLYQQSKRTMNLKRFWGDTHVNILQRPGHDEDADLLMRENARHLDFVVLAYYASHRHWVGPDKNLDIEDWKPDAQLQEEWRRIRRLAASWNRPGRFVAFPGYEWQGDGQDGDHNVFYSDDDVPLFKTDRLAGLYDEIRRSSHAAMVIPHHTAYQVGFRAKNWDIHDPRLSPFAEIYSGHGSSESDEEWIGLRRVWQMGPNVSGGTVADGLDRGHRIGILASTDSNDGFAGAYGKGLAACYAPSLSRQSLWEAFAARRVYGVTGDRIALDVGIDGALMGDVLERPGNLTVHASVRGCDALDRTELLCDNQVVQTHCHQGTWAVPRDGRVRAKIRYEMGWGPKRPWVDGVQPHVWEGTIRLSEGRILSIERCFRREGQRVWQETGSECAFRVTTDRDPSARMPITDALVLEVEAPTSATLRLEADGWRDRCTLLEAMQASRIIHNPDHTAAYIEKTFGVTWNDVRRHDYWYFHAWKVKRHRAIPAAGYSAELRFPRPAIPGNHHYRLRVEQRNGQRAWSSPIWIEEH